MTQTNWSQFFQSGCKALGINIPQKFHTVGEATYSLNKVSQSHKNH